MYVMYYTANIYRMVIGNFIGNPLSAYRILPIGIIRIGKIILSAKGITNEITNNHPIYICSVPLTYQ